MEKPIALEGKALARDTRRAAIRRGFEDFQMHGWQKDPPYPEGDPRRWFWQNGADAADAYHHGRGDGRIERVAGWR